MVDANVTMEVPEQVREFAAKSVDQAETAISTLWSRQANRSPWFLLR